MAVHAQIELYPSSSEPLYFVDEQGDPVKDGNGDPVVRAHEPVAPWGWRKVVHVEPPETIEDSGTVFESRQAALDDAFAKYPHWPIG